ncbi:polysaccharide deacetylase family protein [Amycolatopsis jiangsuensis]|uniref:Peptidoglycan/xylan/chitin deacetylase (PgdA/CDA1 family) n=1 Tax=Amycolatopsis jiangsuensis TaxID=1181879 RepID=A0A840IRY2_9PSEU|nr:polysaccharide deacetylase family protein [Amycolatopsis jiangsuensis]MBB4683918.1 peptidoglycan/xylan/chitin deacetylase (PgdA/CDA1 family) [Amycolatopsis jiangsuensis]
MSYPWPGGARAAVCVTLDFDGESPHLWRTRADPPDSLGELEQRRYGPRRGIRNLLSMLDNLGLRATVFTPGWIADRYPEQVAEIAGRGHELALHGWCHEPPSALPRDDLRRTLERAATTLADLGGQRPQGYRSPSWDMTAEVFPVLHELGVGYDSSLMGEDRPYVVDDLVELPVDWATDDAPYYRYTSGDPRPPATAPVVRAGWAAEIAAAKRCGSLCMITVHPWLSGRPARVTALEELLAPVVADAQLCTPAAAELAAWHREHGEGPRVTLDELGRP